MKEWTNNCGKLLILFRNTVRNCFFRSSLQSNRLNYIVKSGVLKLRSLGYIRLKFDLILSSYKLTHNFFNISLSEISQFADFHS
uniref:Uncharacterized protein n=1 Tax=Ascaris lumbricoides TaxID=6252 RepID=A0A0M3IG33_ASCLU